MTLSSSQPLTEMCTGNFPENVRRALRKADNIAAMSEQII
jgi:hypothetical protein